MLRTISELQGAFQHRVTLMEQKFRELSRQQHNGFEAALERNTLDVQKRLWRDLEEIRGQYENLIHHELKLIRQKAAAGASRCLAGAAAAANAAGANRISTGCASPKCSADRRERIREHQKMYAARFAAVEPRPKGEILDVGCGRGEFLEAARDAGIDARGIDQSDECVAICKSQRLKADARRFVRALESLADLSLAGLYCSQVVEHIRRIVCLTW